MTQTRTRNLLRHCSDSDDVHAAVQSASTFVLQRGQSARRTSQRSMQERWNLWPQPGKLRMLSPVSISARQIGHSHLPNTVSGTDMVSHGRDLMAAELKLSPALATSTSGRLLDVWLTCP